METKLPNEARRDEKRLADVSDLSDDVEDAEDVEEEEDEDERVGAAPSRPAGPTAEEPARCEPLPQDAEVAAIQRPPADS